ncbi:MAG: hypothetical protein IPG66_13100 [Hydrogenophilales bacterium]|nr:hypothetical protein [Hydrogenophilales bacterium]
MIRQRVAWLLLALIPILAQAGNPCALSPRQDGIGGTGLYPVSDGLGGTGHSQDGIGGTGDRQDGIGGTGVEAYRDGIGGTGIVGIVTGFASICVNGVEVDYDEATPVTLNGEPANSSVLGVGQVVAITARHGQQGLTASQIAIQHAVVGHVSRVDPVSGALEILGQKVEPLSGAIRDLDGHPMAPDRIKPGMQVHVSGLRAPDGHILASRIDPVARPAKPHVMGTLKPIAGNMYRIGNLDVRLPPGQVVPIGNVIADIAPDGVAIHRLRPAAQPADVSRVIIQGVVRQQAGNTVQLEQGPAVWLNAGTRITGGTRDELAPGRVVMVNAGLSAPGTWQAESVEIQSSQQLSRRAGKDAPHRRGKTEESASPTSPTPDDADATSGERSGNDTGNQKLDNSASGNEDDTRTDSANTVERIEQNDAAGDTEKELTHLTTTPSGTRRVAERSEKSERSGRSHGAESSSSSKVERTNRSEKTERIEKPEKAEKLEKVERSEKAEKPEKIERPEKAEKLEKVERPEKAEKLEKVERSEKVEKLEKVERSEKVEKLEKVERSEKVEKPEKVERIEKVEKLEKVERPEKVEKLEKIKRPEKAEKPEKIERLEKAEKPEKVERIEKVEKLEKVERPEKAEKPEKIERSEKVEKPEKIEKPERSRD